MSMRTQKALSPTKENLSPTKQLGKGDSISQLLGFIKAAGLKLPSHIEKSLNQESGSFMKVMPTDKSCVKEGQTMQKLKVKLGDTQFELKKLEQDFAQYKLNSRLEKQKQLKRWQQAYNHLKNTLEYSNEDASTKLVKLRQSYEKEIQGLKQKHQAQIKQQKQKITSSYEQKISSLKKLNEREIKELKQKAANQLAILKTKQQAQVKQLRETQESQLRKLCLKHKQTLDAKERQYQSIYVALQSEKKTEQKLHEKTKIEASQAKQKLYSELYYQRNVKKDLEQTIQKRELEIKSLKSQIHDLEIDIILQKERMEKRQQEIRQDYEKQKIGMQQLNKQYIANLLTSHEKQLKKLEVSVHQINEWKENKEALMTERYDEVQSKFDERPSRQEDLDMIEKLRSRLLRKQEQIRLLSKQLKICVMQSQNKQQTYNKIFTSNTMNKFEKKCLTKDREQFKSKDSLCRKSQTTDIKFLLKVYNKHI